MNNVIYIPKGWSEITLEKYQELIGLDIEEYGSPFSYKLEVLAILNETSSDDEIFEELDIDELGKIFDEIKWLSSTPSGLVKDLDLFTLKDIKKITLGEFIDLLKLLENPNDNIDLICGVLYKKYKEDQWGNFIEEPYIYDLETRRKFFKNIPINNIIGILKYFVDFKDIIDTQYNPIFSNPDDLQEPEDTDNLTEEEIEEIKKEIEVEKEKAKWSWMKLIWDLADGDLTKYDEITNLPLLLVLNNLMMIKALDIKK